WVSPARSVSPPAGVAVDGPSPQAPSTKTSAATPSIPRIPMRPAPSPAPRGAPGRHYTVAQAGGGATDRALFGGRRDQGLAELVQLGDGRLQRVVELALLEHQGLDG